MKLHLYDEDETRVCGVCVDQNACSNQLVHCQSRDDDLQAESNPVKHLAKEKANLVGIEASHLSFWRQMIAVAAHALFICLIIVVPLIGKSPSAQQRASWLPDPP